MSQPWLQEASDTQLSAESTEVFRADDKNAKLQTMEDNHSTSQAKANVVEDKSDTEDMVLKDTDTVTGTKPGEVAMMEKMPVDSEEKSGAALVTETHKSNNNELQESKKIASSGGGPDSTDNENESSDIKAKSSTDEHEGSGKEEESRDDQQTSDTERTKGDGEKTYSSDDKNQSDHEHTNSDTDTAKPPTESDKEYMGTADTDSKLAREFAESLILTDQAGGRQDEKEPEPELPRTFDDHFKSIVQKGGNDSRKKKQTTEEIMEDIRIRNLKRETCKFWSYRNAVGRYLAASLNVEWADISDACGVPEDSDNINVMDWWRREKGAVAQLQKALSLVELPEQRDFFTNYTRDEKEMVDGRYGYVDSDSYGSADTYTEVLHEAGVSAEHTTVLGVQVQVPACEEVIWIIQPMTESGDKVPLSNRLVFQAEVRGPSVIVPTIKANADGTYHATFTPTVKGSYQVYIRLDLARGVGDTNCWREETHFMIAQVLPNGPSELKVTGPNDPTTCVKLAEARALSTTHTGEWRKVDCGAYTSPVEGEEGAGQNATDASEAMDQGKVKLPKGWTEDESMKPVITDYIRKACKAGMVENVQGWYGDALDKTLGPDRFMDRRARGCQYGRESNQTHSKLQKANAAGTSLSNRDAHPFFPNVTDQNMPPLMFYPFDVQTAEAMDYGCMRNKWVHLWGDSLDRSALRDSIIPIYNEMLGEQCVDSSVPYVDTAVVDPHKRLRVDVVIHHWPKANITFSFMAVTKRIRAPDFYMFDDEKGHIRDTWPSFAIHQMWATVTPLTGMSRPSAFVFSLALHAAAHKVTTDAYDATLRNMHMWITSGAGKGVPVFWRRSTTTQHHFTTLHEQHKCLFNSQLGRLDDVAMRVTKELGVPVIVGTVQIDACDISGGYAHSKDQQVPKHSNLNPNVDVKWVET
ncbi:hypothetical protein SARC_06322 [Sphaeroforma arctica JP610]|uniref:Uncharacterized protein n=1 Tax=Sphaeroforma arctica JP610 TaxID=667725 RepID=A0A0L0FZF5_9EUKA|nr:hypothetical protein SARC_06322 [Sphaeroforma arctica JP610]KNC81348.1 hypothetical protein SARC_06322 [Sphaeroforma arctica JP610]|eukprot:XP_014155250.1 hypothetical protein SARC_06322 [Sphaeroforma arctica JP610]